MSKINLKCFNCGIEFQKNKNEYNRKIKNNKTNFYCSLICSGYGNISNKNKKYKPINKNCICCDKIFLCLNKDEKTCSKKCRFFRKNNIWTDEQKSKVRNKSIKLWQNPEYVKKQFNNTKFRFTSKGEEEIKKHFKEKFIDDNWTFGPIVINNRTLIRDLFSKKLKVCFEYDGIWHFKNIHGQLKDKQEKDKLLEEWCIKNGWRLIRLREEVYYQNKALWISKLENEIYNGIEQIVKFY